ncbi:uncharacterized protein LOC117177935 [Belonocnema kinseyi]|uniref:uncharacterized protein LOC117177935 n=1 Tax=Belonocnema kinseyi TaxID=2817044 RepID=UPI00143CC96A|nr:uncharacterized protein LOC117177935 [Belonocnema kinseyi]
MVKHCSVESCKNTVANKDVSFHKIPTNPFYRAAWLRVCRKTIKFATHATICSDHFTPECFQPRSLTCEFMDKALNRTSRKLKKLYSNAIPTENLAPTIEKLVANKGPLTADPDESTLHADANDVLTNSNTVSALSSAPNDSESDGSLESSSDIINDMFSSLTNCNFTSEEEKNLYSEKLLKIKQTWSEQVQQLQKDVEAKKQRVEEEKRKNLEKEKKHSEKCEAFLRIILKLRDSEIAWKERCHVYKKRVEHAENKLNLFSREKEEIMQKLQIIFTPGQVKMLLYPKKRTKWNLEDIENAISLYENGPKTYEYLRDVMQFPLPGLTTLRRWMDPIDAEPDPEDHIVETSMDTTQLVEKDTDEALNEAEISECDFSDKDVIEEEYLMTMSDASEVQDNEDVLENDADEHEAGE